MINLGFNLHENTTNFIQQVHDLFCKGCFHSYIETEEVNNLIKDMTPGSFLLRLKKKKKKINKKK